MKCVVYIHRPPPPRERLQQEAVSELFRDDGSVFRCYTKEGGSVVGYRQSVVHLRMCENSRSQTLMVTQNY